MNPHPRAFDTLTALRLPQSVPLRCRTPMPPQPLQVGTPFSILGALATALLFLPRQAALMPAAIRVAKNRRA